MNSISNLTNWTQVGPELAEAVRDEHPHLASTCTGLVDMCKAVETLLCNYLEQIQPKQ
ncbi:MAG: hypothetical protein J0I49_35060 [Pseudonocardia sp.]|uniref:hypothetical protein n=1 Tax=Pseudonocardia sp. TaxID=60912 RepID=UPI001AD3D4B1|nr:hypothetical protein [Pseudonocardia sp.]MBN9103277.1 hypothetical protein [Pseudonocardia sp.]